MKINVVVTVAGKTIKCASMAVTFEFGHVARGIVCAVSPEATAGPVTIDAGINGTVSRIFTGFAERSTRVDRKQIRITIRENSAKLEQRCPISRRNITLADALTAISGAAGVEFRASGTFLAKSTPHFVNLGSGFDAIALVGKLSGYADFVTVGQPDGAVWVGSRSDLPRCNRVIRLDEKLFTAISAVGADLPFLPALQVGMPIAIGDSAPRTIATLQITAEKMHLTFED